MAIAPINTEQAAPGANGGTTSGQSNSGGNLVVGAVPGYQEDTTLCSDNQSNSFANAVRELLGGGGADCKIDYAEGATVGGSHTLTYSESGSYPAIHHLCFSGVLASGSLDTTSAMALSSATSVQPGSVTPSEDGCLLVCTLCVNGSISGLSIDSGFTIAESTAFSTGNNMGGYTAYLVQATAAAINPQWSWTTSRDGSVAMAVFKPAAVSSFTPKGPLNKVFTGPFGGPF